MVGAVGGFIDFQRPLKHFLCAFHIPQILQDTTEVIDTDRHIRMVGAVGGFIDFQRPLKHFFRFGKLCTSFQI